MVNARVSRLAVEVLADAPVAAGLFRQSAQVAAVSGDANTGASVQVSRLALEVLGDAPTTGGLFRQATQVAASATATNTGASVQVSRLAFEVLGDVTPLAATYRQAAQVAVASVFVNTSASAQVARVALEVLADAPQTLTSLNLPAGMTSFLHNWVKPVAMETSYSTGTELSTTGAEKRRGLVGKPYRSIVLLWSAMDRTEQERLVRTIRGMTDGRWGIPIVQDSVLLEQTVGATLTGTVYCNTLYRRFYVGGKVGFYEIDGAGHPTGETKFCTIVTRGASSMVVTPTVNSMTARRWVVAPVMNVEQVFDVQIERQTDLHSRAAIEALEVFGASSLPASDTGIPNGFTYCGPLPVWKFDPNYSIGLRGSAQRDGELTGIGRGRLSQPQADRARQSVGGSYQFEREDFWSALRFFDSRRGSLLPFLAIDQDASFQVATIDPAGLFVSVLPLGDIDDFAAELAYLGLVLTDGTYLAREVVNVQSVFGVWRVTLATPMPAGIATSEVRRVANARKVKFSSDAFAEAWTTTELCTTTLSMREVLRDQEFTT